MMKSKINFLSYGSILLSILVTIVAGQFFYSSVQTLFTKSIQQSVIAIVSNSTFRFSATELDGIKNLDDIKKNSYKSVIQKLNQIRKTNPNVKFAYIQRKTADPNLLKFVADADSLNPFEKKDLNNDGEINEEDALNFPGEDYDVTDYPDFSKIAFSEVYVDQNLSIDKWGVHLSATAPIDANYLLGIDVDVTNFQNLINIASKPFIAFLIFLLLEILVLALVLIKIWSERVKIANELDRQKDAVVHMVAHQFKGPVTTINFTTELLLDGSFGELSDVQKENLTTIRTASQKMGTQSDMVLDAAKITAGKLPLEPGPVDLKALFKEIVSEAENHAKERKVNLKVSLPTELPTVILDKKYTQLSIDNLLSNAVKYTALKSEGGNVDFIVEIKNKTLFCTVRDTGIGIPKKDQENVFKELYRASNAGKDGNGLGLHVAVGAIEAQGGKIHFESTENVGTTFFVELPLKTA